MTRKAIISREGSLTNVNPMSENERLREALEALVYALDFEDLSDSVDLNGAKSALAAKPETCVWKEIDSEDQDTWPMDGEFVLIMCADGDHFAGTMHVCKFVPFVYRDGHAVPEFSMPGHGGIIASHWMSLPTAPAAGAKSR